MIVKGIGSGLETPKSFRPQGRICIAGAHDFEPPPRHDAGELKKTPEMNGSRCVHNPRYQNIYPTPKIMKVMEKIKRPMKFLLLNHAFSEILLT